VQSFLAANTPCFVGLPDDDVVDRVQPARAALGLAELEALPERVVHSWRVAHAALPIGAIRMFAVAALLSSFAVPSPVKWLIAVALIVSSYAFCISLPLAAVVGHRGLSAHAAGGYPSTEPYRSATTNKPVTVRAMGSSPFRHDFVRSL